MFLAHGLKRLTELASPRRPAAMLALALALVMAAPALPGAAPALAQGAPSQGGRQGEAASQPRPPAPEAPPRPQAAGPAADSPREPRFPALTGRVVDAAGVLDAATRARLAEKLAAYEAQTGDQVVVVTAPGLDGLTIEEYANRLFRRWGLGEKDRNNGVLLLVAPRERKVRIEVGYGVEGGLTDALASVIINQAILPKFRAGDFSGGVEAGADAIVDVLKGDAETWSRRARPRGGGDGPPSLAAVLFYVVLLLIFIRIMSRMAGGGGGRGMHRRRSGRWGPVVIPPVGGGWGGGFGGGFGGGGGFSGGGGSSGGGGASGSW